MFFVRRRRDERVAGSGTGAGSKPVQEPSHPAPPARRSKDPSAVWRPPPTGSRRARSTCVSAACPTASRKSPARCSVSPGRRRRRGRRRCRSRSILASGRSAGPVEHLGRNIGEQAGAGEQERVPRSPAKYRRLTGSAIEAAPSGRHAGPLPAPFYVPESSAPSARPIPDLVADVAAVSIAGIDQT